MTTAIRPAEFPWFRYDGYTFSLGVTDGDRAWLSGHSASRYDPGAGRIVVTGGMGEQATTAYEKIGAILAAAGLGWSDVERVVENVTVSWLGDYAEAVEVRERVFGAHRPVVQTVLVERLLRPGAAIEVEVTAGRGGTDTVYLPTILPVDAAGEVVAPGDFRGQYRYCLERAGELLAGLGLDLSHLVQTVDFTTPATRDVYPRCGRARRDLLGPVYPGAAGILASRLGHPEALVALDCVASRQKPVAVNPGWSRYETLTYNPAVRAGNGLYLSGFGALDFETQEAVYPGDVVAQARHIYEAIGAVLKAAGAGPEHLVKTVEFVCPAGLAEYRGVAEVRRELLTEPWPASTGVVCDSLLRPEFLLEVVPTAVLPGQGA